MSGLAGDWLAPPRRTGRALPFMEMAAVLVSLLAALPVLFVGWMAWTTGWRSSAALIFRPRVGELLVNTGLLVILAVPLAMVVSTALAWLTECTDLPGRRVLSWFCVAPLAVPAFVQSYAWISLCPRFQGLPAAVTISVLSYFPFLYLPVAASLRRLDPALSETAAALGLSPWAVFARVTFPQLRLALCGGALLIALHLLSEFGLYVFVRFDTFTTAIVDQYQSSFAGPAATMLASVLVICCLVVIVLEAAARGDARYSRVGSGVARRPKPACLGKTAIPCLACVCAVIALSLGVPFVTIGRWLAAGGLAIWRLDEIVPTLAQTAILAFAGGVLTTAMAVPMAWLSNRAPSRLQHGLEKLNYVIGSLPGIVVALALVTIAVRVVQPLYQTMATILLAYGLMFLPRALISLRASIAQAPIELEQAASALGRGPAQALFATTIRLAAPGAAAGTAMAALGIVNELTATQMLAPLGTHTLAMRFWSFSGEIDYASAAPYAAIMVAISLPFTGWLHVQSKRMAGE
ncbi:iron ABC transporter permease [Jiella sp. CQZ9-1]|uniref:Iron ABC transporter permease n=2 Tax=Jiella flava TaxID=2816857 RepID=A0A939G257_9HYPH|nr:iron ABC transporter permease [Jiella flava]